MSKNKHRAQEAILVSSAVVVVMAGVYTWNKTVMQPTSVPIQAADSSSLVDGNMDGVTAQQVEDAKAAVAKLPEVMEFKQQVNQRGQSTFAIQLGAKPNDKDPNYLMQVVEYFPDRRVSFGWYSYSPDTGTVKKVQY